MSSLGHLQLVYTSYDIEHTCSCRLQNGVDPLDGAGLVFAAAGLALVVAGVMSDANIVTGWRTLNNAGVRLIDLPLADPVQGSHADLGGNGSYRSLTWTFTGKGPPLNDTTPGGQALIRLFIGGWYNPVPGEKAVVMGAYVGMDDLKDYLAGSDFIWADFYGAHASVRLTVPVQFNAWAQKKHGS